jgi:hypothetical protein
VFVREAEVPSRGTGKIADAGVEGSGRGAAVTWSIGNAGEARDEGVISGAVSLRTVVWEEDSNGMSEATARSKFFCGSVELLDGWAKDEWSVNVDSPGTPGA